LKHIAVDENKTVGELIEEGMSLVVKKSSAVRED
jgi:hypothetical protein